MSATSWGRCRSGRVFCQESVDQLPAGFDGIRPQFDKYQHMVTRFCHSAHRCNQIACATCCWRAARNTTLQIQNKSNGRLHTITLTIPDHSPESFRGWRVEIRNWVDYLRRKSATWRNFGLHRWLRSNGTGRGIVTLGRLGRDEVENGFLRWSATLGPEIGHDDLRAALWSVVRPSAVSKEAG